MKKRIIAIALTFVMVLSLAACSGSKTENPSSSSSNSATGKPTNITTSKDTIIVAVSSDVGSLDPMESTQQPMEQVLSQMYQTLFERDPESGKLIGCLCESWEYEDDCTIILTLRKGVKFHNGEEMKASDVLFSLKRLAENGVTQMPSAHIDYEKTTALDEYTVKLVTTSVYMPQIALLEWPPCVILSEKGFNDNNGDFSSESFGTGPYKLTEWSTGDYVKMEKFDDYWEEGYPIIENVVMRFITDSTVRIMELESGGVDLAYDVSPNDAERLQASNDITVKIADGMNTRYLFFNCARAPYNDARVRQAVWYALDREVITKTAWGNTASQAEGYLNPTVDGYYDGLDMRERDVEKAKELLAEAGYPNGFDTTIYLGTTSTDIEMAQVMQSQLSEAGIHAEINILEDSVLSEARYGQFDLLIYGYTSNTGEANRILGRLHKDANEAKNQFGWQNDEYSELIDKANSTVDPTERNEYFAQAQMILCKEAVMIPIMNKPLIVAHSNTLQNFKISTTYEQHRLRYLYFN